MKNSGILQGGRLLQGGVLPTDPKSLRLLAKKRRSLIKKAANRPSYYVDLEYRIAARKVQPHQRRSRGFVKVNRAFQQVDSPASSPGRLSLASSGPRSPSPRSTGRRSGGRRSAGRSPARSLAGSPKRPLMGRLAMSPGRSPVRRALAY